MAVVADEQTFSIPFRYLWSTNLAGDLDLENQRPTGLARFVGDEENKILRILVDQEISGSGDSIGAIWPLVLFGPTGTGKTSLAINLISEYADRFGEHPTIRSKQTAEKPILLTALDFDRKFRSALETNSVTDFRKRIVQGAGLVLDDVQNLNRKTTVQQELVRLIDEMSLRNRPLVLTMDEDPLQCDELIPQLASRLSGGLSLPVRPPGQAARYIIVRDLCQINSLELDEAAVNLLVERLNVTVPRIVSFLQQLQTLVRAEKGEENPIIDVRFINRMFDHSEDDRKRISKIIIDQVAAEYRVKPADLRGNSRKQSIVMARAIAIYLNRKLLGTSFLKIGSLFGNRDHSTIMHAYRKIESIVDEAQDRSANNQSAITTSKKIEKLERQMANQFAHETNV